MSVRAPESMAPPGTAHGRPPDLVDSHKRGSTVLGQNPIDSKALVRMLQMRRPVIDEGAGAHIDPWLLVSGVAAAQHARMRLEAEAE